MYGSSLERLSHSKDIERMYGQRKPIAQRTPLFPQTRKSASSSQSTTRLDTPDLVDDISTADTPAITEGETATETSELETETEHELEQQIRPLSKKSSKNAFSPSSSQTKLVVDGKRTSKAVSQYDLLNRYFRNDTVLLHNIDLLRSVGFLFECPGRILTQL